MLLREEGISLIELVVTIAFIGIIIIAFTVVFINSVQVEKMSERRNQALNLAAMVMEELQNYDYDLLVQGEHDYNLDKINDDFILYYQIKDPDPDEKDKWDKDNNPLLKEITVIVRWEEGGQIQKVQLTTYRAKTVF
ncbi:hypothetical protein BBF96_14565 [Anoxybacter fermentans]|uniref:Prepilin-type N-terminal cleavage/methylation domain-containing protein n=1 Tax=Anoxybacter fermentans TaxID=1323375 RepID=A0A3Q9HS47_9FIRM|nr:hypothetical protein [Anoxybacter fermentans]AZR74500.1 hypothetical protein BBF96_14565 [Anoxybacter fermentans]